jgi:hypothetical protein
VPFSPAGSRRFYQSCDFWLFKSKDWCTFDCSEGAASMNFISAISRILIGVLFGCGSAIALSPAFAAIMNNEESSVPAGMIALILLCGAVCFSAPSIRRAFGRGFLMLGVSVFILPISTFLLSGRAASEVVRTAEDGSEAMAAVGAGLAGVAITGAATFVGLILGSILLLIGLVLSLGGRREVIVVETVSRKEPYIRS